MTSNPPATERVHLQTFVTCPFLRYHPAVVAQQAATMALLSGGRFTLGVGALLYAVGCLAMMAIMMTWMNHADRSR